MFVQYHALTSKTDFSELRYFSVFADLFSRSKPALEILPKLPESTASQSVFSSSSGFFSPAKLNLNQALGLLLKPFNELPEDVRKFVTNEFNKRTEQDFSVEEFWFFSTEQVKASLMVEYACPYDRAERYRP
ncbi:hypothetical protein [Legionella worsleiensis]|uniref:Uncharacterized protein n=1 Tax=Legionella worsleiensis TaxID=45076 RepID=A0A0W1A927_9GAMM|nr:hypothetical protein [Legionella worsleiensis]KTD77855.1 hypothetical protein Lwor_1737 [Legionella worsleiensis]STY33097.1 Uncharacterised protein [Legionella worsleiensis]